MTDNKLYWLLNVVIKFPETEMYRREYTLDTSYEVAAST